jgi:hypothetical protein
MATYGEAPRVSLALWAKAFDAMKSTPWSRNLLTYSSLLDDQR